eukprot:m.658149 g.658149  ORF g.658149 m.658149 type:complete len:317 (+) comp22716_c0_seq47:761-1711(+)
MGSAHVVQVQFASAGVHECLLSGCWSMWIRLHSECLTTSSFTCTTTHRSQRLSHKHGHPQHPVRINPVSWPTFLCTNLKGTRVITLNNRVIRGRTLAGTTSVHLAQGTTSSIISASAVILAVPPQALAAAVEFDPQLPPSLSDAMATTRTWMHGIVKIAVSYSRPFWREQQLSGSANVQRPGNVFQVTWDNSDDKNGVYALAGFARQSAASAKVLSDLAEIFGKEALQHDAHVEHKDWGDDVYGVPSDEPVQLQHRMHHNYGAYRRHAAQLGDIGHPHVIFSGTESEAEHGHMEGAVISGTRAAREAWKLLQLNSV